MSDKKELRKELIAKRKEFIRKQTADQIIFDKLIHTAEFEKASTIFTYISVGFEVDTIRLINYALSKGKRICVPLCEPRTETMNFYEISSLGDTHPGNYNIPEPKQDRSMLRIPSGYDVIIVPGLAFDINTKQRIGYGKGYYDKYLSQNEVVSIGLCYKDFLIEHIPADEYDIPINIIITD